jgi:GAF domain-containing protein
MEPVRGTKQALDILVSQGDPQVAVALMRMGREARRLIPSCIGLSLTFVGEDLTFTLVATGDELAGLDPPEAGEAGPAHGMDEPCPEDLLDERRWQEYARASAAAGVASSLSLPIVRDGCAIGSVSVYAAMPDAFDEGRAVLAAALGVEAEGAIANADLEFRSRRAAAQAPGRLTDADDVDIAIGLVATLLHVGVSDAEERLRDAARRVGISPGRAARLLRFLTSS